MRGLPAILLGGHLLLLAWHLFLPQYVSSFQTVHKLARFSRGSTIMRLRSETEGIDNVEKPKFAFKSSPEASSDDYGGGDLPFFASWPRWVQNGIRDLGGVRLLVNAATRSIAAPIFYFDNPWCFPEFVRISGGEYPWLVSALRLAGTIGQNKPDVDFSKEAYGDHPSQVAQVMIAKDVDESDRAAPLFIFFHGGAWGSGFPTMYRLLSLPFLERNFRAVILGYRTFPDATVDGQLDDLVLAVDFFAKRYRGIGGNGGPVVLMGHSSGAHVSMLAAMQGRVPAIDALVAASGVYDIEKQFESEKRMGVSEISPMSAANGFTLENLRKFSPAQLTNALPGDFPPVLLIHGESDDVASPQNSKDFYDVLDKRATIKGQKRNAVAGRVDKGFNIEILDGIGHQDVVTETCLGGKAQSIICDWIGSTVAL